MSDVLDSIIYIFIAQEGENFTVTRYDALCNYLKVLFITIRKCKKCLIFHPLLSVHPTIHAQTRVLYP